MSSDAIYDQAFGGLIDVRRLGSDPDPDEIRTVADELLSVDLLPPLKGWDSRALGY